MDINEYLDEENILLTTLDNCEPRSFNEFRERLANDISTLSAQSKIIKHSTEYPKPFKSFSLLKPLLDHSSFVPWKAVSPPVHKSYKGAMIDDSPSHCDVKNPFLMGMYGCTGISPPHLMRGSGWKHHTHTTNGCFNSKPLVNWSDIWHNPEEKLKGAIRTREEYIKRGMKRYKSVH